jgi:translation initiation factor 2B subunit (eIF-2B alpha/beta/delta family)
VQLEAFTNNEQGNPEDVVEGRIGGRIRRVINLLYDLTPAASISGIITEMGSFATHVSGSLAARD